jgi:hypothetical protein
MIFLGLWVRVWRLALLVLQIPGESPTPDPSLIFSLCSKTREGRYWKYKGGEIL